MSVSESSSELAKLCWKDAWDSVIDRMSSFGGELRQGDSNLILPLHIAVWHKAPRDVIDEMIRLYPAAIGAKTKGGHYPVDYAKLFNADDVSLVEALVVDEVAEETAAKEAVEESGTALHKLCHWKFREAGDRVKLYPEEAAFQDGNGDLALHIAVEHSAPVTLINELLSANPAGAWHSNKSGKLPLHVATKSWVKKPVLQALVAAYPTGVNATDNYGDLPINFAMKEFPEQDILKLLEPNAPSTPKWSRIMDDSSGHYYYENQFTKETSWERPKKGFFE